MKTYLALTLAGLLALAACSDDGDPAAPGGVAGLAGTWNLQSWTWTRDGVPGDTADWVQELGLSGRLVVSRTGGFTATPALPWGFGQDDGMLTVEGDSIYWDGHDDEEWVRFTLASGTLTLTWPEVEFVDLDLDGSPEDAWLVVTYTD